MAKEKILIVDDEEHILELLDFNLKNAGYETFIATDGIEAVKWAIDSDDYIAALKNELTMVASLTNQSYSEVERILDQNFSNLIKK